MLMKPSSHLSLYFCILVGVLGQTYHHGLPPTSHSSCYHLSFLVHIFQLYYGVTTNLLVASCGICGITNSKEQIAKRSVFIFHNLGASREGVNKLCATVASIVATIIGIIPLHLNLLEKCTDSQATLVISLEACSYCGSYFWRR